MFLEAKLDGGSSVCWDNWIVEKDWVSHKNNIWSKARLEKNQGTENK